MAYEEYWIKRADARMAQVQSGSDQTIMAVSEAYEDAMKQLNKDIDRLFFRFAGKNGLSKEDAYDSIKRAQDYLRNVIGSDGNYLCYPVGKYNDETIAIEEELGIKAAVTTQGGIASINDGIHTLKRVRISPMSIDSFASIFSEYIN